MSSSRILPLLTWPKERRAGLPTTFAATGSRTLWPPSSPDLNPLDYYVCGVVKREANGRPHITIQSVKDLVYGVMTNMSRVSLAKPCEHFCHRIETVVASEGSFID